MASGNPSPGGIHAAPGHRPAQADRRPRHRRRGRPPRARRAAARAAPRGAAHTPRRADQAPRRRAESGAHPEPGRAATALHPGIGRLAAFTILLESDGIQRFRSVRAFVSCCRLVPGAGTSGGRTRHKRTKDGNRHLTLAFSHAAARAIQYVPEIRAFHRASARRTSPAVAGARRQGARADRPRRAHEAGGLPWHLQGRAAASHEAADVATPGQPARPAGAALTQSIAQRVQLRRP